MWVGGVRGGGAPSCAVRHEAAIGPPCRRSACDRETASGFAPSASRAVALHSRGGSQVIRLGAGGPSHRPGPPLEVVRSAGAQSGPGAAGMFHQLVWLPSYRFWFEHSPAARLRLELPRFPSGASRLGRGPQGGGGMFTWIVLPARHSGCSHQTARTSCSAH